MMEETRRFFASLSRGMEQGQRNVLNEILERFTKELQLDETTAKGCLQELVEGDLVRYFAQPKFMTANWPGRVGWVRNLMVVDRTGMGRHRMEEAAARVTRQLQTQQGRLDENGLTRDRLGRFVKPVRPEDVRQKERENHPLSPYEWSDEEGRRFYDDDVDGQVRIPATAAPRPSAQSVWNVMKGEWAGG